MYIYSVPYRHDTHTVSRLIERALHQNMQLNMTWRSSSAWRWKSMRRLGEAHRLLMALKPSRARAQAACLPADRCKPSDLSRQPARRLVVGIVNARRAADFSCPMREHANAHNAKRDRARKHRGECCCAQRSHIVRMETGRGHGGGGRCQKAFRLERHKRTGRPQGAR